MATLALVMLGGCRQLLGLDDPVVGGGDATIGGGDGPVHDGPADARGLADGALLDAPQVGPAFVQGNAGALSQGGLYTLAFNEPQHAGDLNLVVVAWTGTATYQGVSDTTQNSYTQLGPIISHGTRSQLVTIASNIAAGANAVTVTFSDTATAPELRILEYRDISTQQPIDSYGLATGSAAELDFSVTTSHAHDVLVGFDVLDATTITPDPQYVQREIVAGDLVEDREVTTVGTYDATATQTGTADWVMQLIAFELAN